MPVTTVDIARELNLSQTTISKVLSGRNNASIPDATKERVMRAAEQMGYRPNHMARILRSGRSYMISLLVRRIRPSFYSRSLGAFQEALRDTGYDLRIQETWCWTPERWTEAAVDRWPADGIIVIESVNHLPFLATAAKNNVPIVNVGTAVVRDIDYVEVDLHSGTVAAVQHLLDAGRRKIVYLGPFSATETARCIGYVESMESAGLQSHFVTTAYHSGQSDRTAGLDAITGYLASGNRIDAIVCFNDEIAIGALRGVKEHGLQVPGDVAIVGCDDIDDAAFHDPPLSTLHYPYEDAAQKAWEMLVRRIETPDLATQSLTIPSTLVIRQSSSPKQQTLPGSKGH